MSKSYRPSAEPFIDKKEYCGRCGLVFRHRDLTPQRGIRVCRKCYDEPGYNEGERR